MQVDIRHLIAALIVVATLLVVGVTATLLQDDPVQSRRLDVESAVTCVPITPERPLPTEIAGFVNERTCTTPTHTPEAGDD
ncbi:MAG: hypothetical protein WD939_04110 [Dehalococcoidia bacterium]